jgi:ribosomal protein S18 acetylase RimI-like enzyme
MSARAHPNHNPIALTLWRWFHDPFEGIGYRAQKRPWGTYWSHGGVYCHDLPLDQAHAFLGDLRAYYSLADLDDDAIQIIVDDPEQDARLGPVLLDAGWTTGKTDLFLAHVGPMPAPPIIEGLRVDEVSAANVRAFVTTRLRAFSDDDTPPDSVRLTAQVAQRQGELTGSGRGMLVRVKAECDVGEYAASMWWYDEPEATWIVLLGVRAPFRRRGIARWLLCQRLIQAQTEGKPALINVTTENIDALRLYRRLGFTDVVYRRRRYNPSGSPTYKEEATNE